jgi:hypothetical protein
VISAAFIFRPGTYDDEFHRLNKLIDAAAKATEGFLGSETWKSFDHLEAKKQYSRWYDGYHIVVSEVIRSYGDDVIQHLTPNDRAG